MISRAKLAGLARGAGVSERAQEKDYVLAWLLWAMAVGGESGLVFKGGTALRRDHSDARPSTHLRRRIR